MVKYVKMHTACIVQYPADPVLPFIVTLIFAMNPGIRWNVPYVFYIDFTTSFSLGTSNTEQLPCRGDNSALMTNRCPLSSEAPSGVSCSYSKGK